MADERTEQERHAGEIAAKDAELTAAYENASKAMAALNLIGDSAKPREGNHDRRETFVLSLFSTEGLKVKKGLQIIWDRELGAICTRVLRRSPAWRAAKRKRRERRSR
jgi:hypothetical protein